MLDLRPSPDQQQIIDSISGYLQRDFPVDRFQPDKHSGNTVRAAWSELAGQGFFGLAASEEVGGAGFTVVEEMLAHREFGRALLSPCVLAAALAVAVAQQGGLDALAGELVAGERKIAIGNGFGPVPLAPVVEGALQLFDSEPGDLILIRGADGLALIERDALGDIEEVLSLDDSVTMHRAHASAVKPVGFAPASDALLQRSTLLLAAALAGMAEETRDIAVAHAAVREQFGKPIGAFQGVAHHCADMELRGRAARAQTAFAAIALRDGRADAPFHVSAAMIVATNAAIANATIGIRILGGMGFTAECALHLYLKRAHLYERLAGRTRSHQKDILERSALDFTIR